MEYRSKLNFSQALNELLQTTNPILVPIFLIDHLPTTMLSLTGLNLLILQV